MHCPVCGHGTPRPFSRVSDVDYFECAGCGSLFADPAFIEQVEHGAAKAYADDYWEMELASARERSFGSSLARVAEVFFYCRVPIHRFLDIGSGPGYLLDALAAVLPSSKSIFHAVELFPPPEQFRTTHPNYLVGGVADAQGLFEAGTCIEVIEHLPPNMLRRLVADLATKSSDGASYYFGSGQPDYVKNEDPAYLDPRERGHIVSYSIAGLTPLFAEAGFTVVPLSGRSWAFLAEYRGDAVPNADQLLGRIWTPCAENVARLKDPAFGPLMHTMGLESGRCYAEAAIAEWRGRWAQGLEAQLQKRKRWFG